MMKGLVWACFLGFTAGCGGAEDGAAALEGDVASARGQALEAGPAAAPVKPGSRGREFWIAFPTNVTSGTSAELTLRISAETAATGTVRIPGLVHSQGFSVMPGQVASVTVPSGAALA